MIRQSSSTYFRFKVLRKRCISNTASSFSNAASSAASNLYHDEYNNTFTPLPILPGIHLKNRIIMGSMHSGLEPHSIPSFLSTSSSESHSHHLEALAEYYLERVRGDVSLIVTGGIAPNRRGWVGPFAAKLTSKKEAEQHSFVTKAVHDADREAKICMQILHTGRYAMHPFLVGPSQIKAPINVFTPKEMSNALVKETIQDYVNCALLAQEAGYDGVEIMGSEGYLIHQFLSQRTNRRQDEYGGKDFIKRMKFALDIVKQTKAAVGDSFIIIYRLSMLDLIMDNSDSEHNDNAAAGGADWEEIKIMAQELQAAGVTILNTGIGWHEARIPTIATCVPRAAFVPITTQKLKRENILDIPLVASNRINDPNVIETILSHQDGPDLISMARPFLADSHIVQKMKQGRSDEINTCIGCNQACLDHIFYGRVTSCLVNPRAGHELEFKKKDQEKAQKGFSRKNIAVVGAGPAGMAFAVKAAQLKHNVTLFDQSPDLGGQFNMAKRIPGKEEFYEMLRYFHTQITKKLKDNISLRLNTRVNASDLISSSSSPFDRVVIATGVKPRTPQIPGIEHPKVLSYIQVLRDRVPVGQKVAIIGAGGIGFDVAEFLLHSSNEDHDDDDDKKATSSSSPANDVSVNDFYQYWNIDPNNSHRGGLLPHNNNKEKSTRATRQITLLQRKQGKLGAGLGKTTGWIHRTHLKKGNVSMIGGCTYDKIDEEGNLHITITNNNKKTKQQQQVAEKKILKVDNIVLCAGQESVYDLEHEILSQQQQQQTSTSSSLVFRIGGAFKAGELDAKRAISMGERLAYCIDEDDPQVEDEDNRIKGDEERVADFFRRFIG